METKQIKTNNTRELEGFLSEIATRDNYTVDALNQELGYDQTLQVLSKQKRYADAADFARSQKQFDDAKEFYLKDAEGDFDDCSYDDAIEMANELGQKREEFALMTNKDYMSTERGYHRYDEVVELAMELGKKKLAKKLFNVYISGDEHTSGLKSYTPDLVEYSEFYNPAINMASMTGNEQEIANLCNFALPIARKNNMPENVEYLEEILMKNGFHEDVINSYEANMNSNDYLSGECFEAHAIDGVRYAMEHGLEDKAREIYAQFDKFATKENLYKFEEIRDADKKMQGYLATSADTNKKRSGPINFDGLMGQGENSDGVPVGGRVIKFN